LAVRRRILAEALEASHPEKPERTLPVDYLAGSAYLRLLV
jgi:hypothetical protein